MDGHREARTNASTGAWNGTLVPEQIQFVQADTGDRLRESSFNREAAVTAETVVLEPEQSGTQTKCL